MADIKFFTGTMSPRFQLVLLLCLLGLFTAGAWFTYSAVQASKQTNTKTINSITRPASSGQITNFQQCAAAGNPVQQTYPETCTTKSGQRFINQ